ncbi:arginine--tRNA ligase [Streptomyces sp. MNU76]|uniref:ArgS-related anticodon-binding protein NrtL n=1 Tax=Streptomyces sp. MNU76 TaxID=2560026 RepID=UPI001E53F493|nr:DALR anticodon-binding domain-containing protein [Streptomyces sp. MNU76]MCC9709664.1 arginine--tRNA ligase [Streptomyces sp. MNU76]
MTPVELSRTVLRAVRRAVDDGELSVAVPARAVVTPPGPGGRGDYATNIALQLARPAGRPPLQVAEILRPHLSRTDGVAAVEITGPGFLNIHLDRAAVTALVRRIQGNGGAPDTTSALPYGHSDTLAGHVVRLRIPYDIRAEVVADALVRIIASQGGRVEVDHVSGPLLKPGADDRSRATPLGAPETALTSALTSSTPSTSAPSPPRRTPPPRPRRPPLGPAAPAAHDRPRITADLLVQRAANPGSVTPTPGPARSPATPRASGSQATSPPRRHRPRRGHPLVSALTEYPSVLARAATHRAPDRLARHLVVLADALLAFQHTVLPRGDEKPSAAHRARLALAEAAGTVLAGGLSLLGIDAPEYL